MFLNAYSSGLTVIRMLGVRFPMLFICSTQVMFIFHAYRLLNLTFYSEVITDTFLLL